MRALAICLAYSLDLTVRIYPRFKSQDILFVVRRSKETVTFFQSFESGVSSRSFALGSLFTLFSDPVWFISFIPSKLSHYLSSPSWTF